MRSFLLLMLCACTAVSSDPEIPSPEIPVQPPGPLACHQTEQALNVSFLTGAAALPDGTTLVAGYTLATRSPDGVWSFEEAVGRKLAASPEGDVWAYSTDSVMRRTPSGVWESLPLPSIFLPNGPLGLRSHGPDDFEILLGAMDPLTTTTEVSSVWWDGVDWTITSLGVFDHALRSASYTVDGRLVLAGSAGVDVQQADGSFTRVDFGLPPLRGAFLLADGTLVVTGQYVAIGTVDGPTEIHEVPGRFTYLAHAAIAPDDIWLLFGDTSEADTYLLHWDGDGWTPIFYDAWVVDIEVVGDEVLLVGGRTGSHAAIGGVAGFDAELDAPGFYWIKEIAVDDVTGEAIAVGEEGAWMRSDGGPWVSQDPDPLLNEHATLGISNGRIVAHTVVSSQPRLAVIDSTGTQSIPLDSDRLDVLCGSQGILFALGAGNEEDGTLRPRGRVNSGDGWEVMDVSGIPTGAIISCHASAPDDLWVGLSVLNNNGGGVAHWDGEVFEVVLATTVDPVGWIEQQWDGRLWFSLGLGTHPSRVFVLHEGEATVEPLIPPRTRQAHLLSDGSAFIYRVPEFGYGAFERLQEDGTVSTVMEAYYSAAVFGSFEDQVWMGYRSRAIMVSCEPDLGAKK